MKYYYYILGVNSTATESLIKSAYRKLSIKFHPDKNDGDKFFEERFKEIQEAYETLSNNDKRMAYDEEFTNSSKSQNSKSNSTEYEENLRKKYENELKRREEEIKRKYQTPEQKHNEEYEIKRKQAEEQKKQEKQNILKELSSLENQLIVKEKTISELQAKIKFSSSEISHIKTQIDTLKSKLSLNGQEGKHTEQFSFNLKENENIISILETIKTTINKEEQKNFIKMFLSYAKSFSINSEYSEKHPNLLKIILNGKINCEPINAIYQKINKLGQDPSQFESEIINYVIK